MSCTNVNGYILPIMDLSISQKFGSNVSIPAIQVAATVDVDCLTVPNAGVVTAAQLLNGYITTSGAAAGYTVTTPTGAALSTAILAATGVAAAVGTSFSCVVSENSSQQMTWTAGASGVTVVGTATLESGRVATAYFLCTAANTWKTFLDNN
jgi:hypothetical protein